MREHLVWIWNVAMLPVSLFAHVLAYIFLLSLVPSFGQGSSAEFQEFDVIEPVEEELPPLPEPEEEEEELPVEEEPEPEPEPIRVREPAAEEVPEPPAPEEETPLDFTGQTLVAEGPGDGFTAPVGSGAASDQPLGRPNARVTGRSRPGIMGGTPGGMGTSPQPVPLRDLRERPSPPGSIARVLERNYPADARSQGIEGTARVSIQIRPNGSIRVLRVLSQSHPSFGPACSRTLEAAGSWEAGVDRNGVAVITNVPFTCTFQVRY